GVSYEMTVGRAGVAKAMMPAAGLATNPLGVGGRGGATAGTSGGGFGGVAGGGGGLGLNMREDKPVQGITPEELFKTKVDKGLRSATKKVDVQIWLTDLDEKTKKALEAAGLHIEGSADRLKIVFGSCDATSLKA